MSTYLYGTLIIIFDKVTSNPTVDNISQFLYLKGGLEEKADEAISEFSVTSENYD